MDSILVFLSQYPVVFKIIVIMGICRAIFKPLFLFLEAVAEATPSKADNELLEKAKSSLVYRYVANGLDFVASIKLPK